VELSLYHSEVDLESLLDSLSSKLSLLPEPIEPKSYPKSSPNIDILYKTEENPCFPFRYNSEDSSRKVLLPLYNRFSRIVIFEDDSDSESESESDSDSGEESRRRAWYFPYPPTKYTRLSIIPEESEDELKEDELFERKTGAIVVV